MTALPVALHGRYQHVELIVDLELARAGHFARTCIACDTGSRKDP
jgi:hypothetical protein